MCRLSDPDSDVRESRVAECSGGGSGPDVRGRKAEKKIRHWRQHREESKAVGGSVAFECIFVVY